MDIGKLVYRKKYSFLWFKWESDFMEVELLEEYTDYFKVRNSVLYPIYFLDRNKIHIINIKYF